MNKEIVALFNKVSIIQVILDENFEITPYLHLFNQVDQKKMLSYYHYKDKLISFTSSLLQKLYLPYFVNCTKDQFIIDYTKYHKPYISSPTDIANKYNFNIAHCYNNVILAIYQGDEYTIGVDIEQIDNNIEIDELSRVVFSDSERNLICGQATNFFKLWAKKESLIKALGTGFATNFYQDTKINLDDYEITNNYHIVTCQVGNYFLSICLYKA